MSTINAIFLSLVAGIITAVPAFLSEIGKRPPKDIPLLVDIKSFWGRKLSNGEVFWLGLFIHLVLAALFGAMYELIVVKSLVDPYHINNLVIYATFFWLFVGGVVFPVVGLGLFGKKEGKWVWLELLVVQYLLAFFIWLGVFLFPVLKP